ncbi:hypothetical protein CERSUDRAFT_113443 [Gelatoporia subvermispora B]|uniref:L-ornithine N(5)-monooxygenase n=1 Tax=Ceriporiopsis subvermispora (strain B) TaxID=914234 RepID=SIDA_CERS8|nr:RecName: Full=L-ornithine N(5)-monooxygenase; AltName: Full=Basidioferrin biosynthesis protein SMO1; AltName: Full=L-ornithine N(5)-oxygenase; AltName: Full=Siderophore biosynthesis protein SMO1 [Gelatoporia subvermispora B]EMD38274.1 hypothetical protein CERSUDRAFT_113443 [Gelatoporia subvermispora B]
MEAQDPLFDLIGLGFGPANLAIAGAIVEKWEGPSAGGDGGISAHKVLFIEKQPEFQWHPGMLLPNTRMQISFLKDLATLRSPQSPLTFLSYLHAEGRLLPFINRGSFTPTRREYFDYLSWAARTVESKGIKVQYGEEVVSIRGSEDNTVEVHSRDVKTGTIVIRRTRNLVISPGGNPKLPPNISLLYPHPRILHSSRYATSVDQLLGTLSPANRPLRIAVIGSGQSAAEVTLDLHSRLSSMPGGDRPHAIDMIFRNGSLKPSDDSPFSNEIFDPDTTEVIYNLPTQSDRENILKEYNNTNYSVVNPRTIDAMYEVMYDQKLDDAIARRKGDKATPSAARITMHPHMTLYFADDLPQLAETDSATETSQEGIRLTLQNVFSQAQSTRDYDAVVCATGYDRTSWLRMLTSSDIGKHFGLNLSSDPVQLVPSTEIPKGPDGSLFDASEEEATWRPASPITPASPSPPSTPTSSALSQSRMLGQLPITKLYITREYCLVPNSPQFKPRIYLQGCTEATHGLSESLLSILGVRAGLVVDDLWKNSQ